MNNRHSTLTARYTPRRRENKTNTVLILPSPPTSNGFTDHRPGDGNPFGRRVAIITLLFFTSRPVV